MKLNRFNIFVTGLSVLVAVSGYYAVHSLYTGHLWITRVSLFMAWAFLLYSLIRYVNLTNRKLEAFLQSLRYFDHVSEKGDEGGSFRRLNLTFNEIIDTAGIARKDLEVQGHYYRNILEHAETGLFSFDKNGKVGTVNRSALEVLDLPLLRNIDDLEDLQCNLPVILTTLQPGENRLVTVVRQGRLRRLSFRAARMKIMGDQVTIISVQDIHAQLEEEELEAWQKLISILRHEIMNSAAPLKSLSGSLRRLTGKIEGDANKEVVESINEGLEAIANRSGSLLHFVEAYRALTKIPEPRIESFRLAELLHETATLYKAELNQRKVKLTVETGDPAIMVHGDYNLLGQVFINLVRNALDAVQDGSGEISITSSHDRDGAAVVEVADNGHGIGEEEQKRIFIPFFTTRKEGSGIGLSLVRQILMLHKATIDVYSKPGSGTTFKIRF